MELPHIRKRANGYNKTIFSKVPLRIVEMKNNTAGISYVLTKGIFPLSNYLYLRTFVNYTCTNKIEAIQEGRA